MFWNRRIPLFVLSLLWLFSFCLINPVGEFPLNDDWSYTRSFLNLYENGKLELLDFTSMPLIGQLLWALPFAKIIGFSFFLLRCTTMLLGLAGILFFHATIKKTTGSEQFAFLGSLLLMVNPFTIHLSATFMTDIPFLSFLLIAIYFLTRALQSPHWKWFICGIFFLTWATMVRQLGLVAGLSFSLAFILTNSKTPSNILKGLSVFIVPLLCFLAYGLYLKYYSHYPALYDEGSKQIHYHLFKSDYPVLAFLGRQIFSLWAYAGLLLFPLLLLMKYQRKTLLFCFALSFAAFSAYFYIFKMIMPFMGNIINPYGMGIVTLRDVMILKHTNYPALPSTFWWIVTILSMVGTGMLLYTILKTLKAYLIKPLLFHPEKTFLGLFILLYSITMVLGGAFDRYLLPLIPTATLFILIGYSQTNRRYLSHIPIITCFVYLVFSIILTRDYFNWNQTRWEAIQYLTDNDIPPSKIDGGFEFNGYYLYNNSPWQPIEDPAKKSWWWVDDDLYLISFGKVDGYQSEKVFLFRRTFPWTIEEIHVLKRNDNLP